MDEIHSRGWDVQKVDINGDGLYEATGKNPYGETLSKVGPDPNTALGHLLIGVMRQETMRYPRTAAWTATWEHERPEIAQAYADAPVYDPKAAGAWKELGEDSQRRAEAIANQIRVDFTHDPYPYKDVNEMAEDIRNKQHVTISKANLAHPLWSSDQALAYRTVHDVLGHASVGGDWGWHGENGATSAHMPLLSPNAQKALFTEAIGQAAHNSYFRQMAPQKVVFLDDYLTKVQERENAAGHSGIHPSQSLVPTGIPSIEEGGGKSARKASGSSPLEPWSWGNWGKGFIDPTNDETVTWNTKDTKEEGFRGQSPHHVDVAAARHGVDPKKVQEAIDFAHGGEIYYHSPITIAPNGQYVSSNDLNGSYEPDGQEGRFEREYTPLRYRGDTRDWSYDNAAEGGGYGHAPFMGSVIGKLDPNDGWSSGIEPLPDNAYLWQKEQSGLDPLDHFGVRDQAYKLDRGWFGLQDHEGVPDLESHRQAVANAFRSTLLEPRQTPRWAATHYQHIQHIPAGVSDPLRFSDTLEAQREAHNKARGLPEGIARAEMSEGSKALRNWIKGLNPKMDDTQVDELARRELFHMIAEEEAQVTAEDPGGQLLPMQITDAVNKGLKRRLAIMTKPSVDQKFDFGKERLFHQGFNAPDPGVYGDFLNSHVRPIAGVGLHIDDLTRAAREDVSQHGGKGYHFRAKASDLIPGVGPKEISHAWYKLQPHTSELGVIGPSVAEGLGYDRAKEITPRDYFKMERQLAAGRDASGYGHVPLGQFSSGMHDQINYGHGVHRDLSPTAVLSPTPYDQVDWTQYPNLPTQDWNDPYWWQSSEPNRDQIAQDWDQMVAINHPANRIPYRIAASPKYYHVAPVKHRDSIMKNGLTPGYNPVWKGDPAEKRGSLGTYLFADPDMAHWWADKYMPLLDRKDTGVLGQYDIYEATPQDELLPDDMMGEGTSFIAPNGVPLQQLRMYAPYESRHKTSATPYEYPGPDLTNGIWTLPQSAQGVSRVPYITHPESGEIIEGDPNLSLMQHAKNTLGMTTEEIWAQDPEVGKMNTPLP